jgi:hypothetical protein
MRISFWPGLTTSGISMISQPGLLVIAASGHP